MFMLLANAIAIQIVVIGTEIQRKNSPSSSMDEGVTEGADDRSVTTDHEQRITSLRCDRCSELASGRMVFVIPPDQILGDFLGVVGKDAFKLLLGDSHLGSYRVGYLIPIWLIYDRNAFSAATMLLSQSPAVSPKSPEVTNVDSSCIFESDSLISAMMYSLFGCR